MWKTIKPVLADLFSSKKALAIMAAAIVYALSLAKIVATPEQILPILGLVGFYVLGQGLSDQGKGAVKEAAKLGKGERSEDPEAPTD